MATWEMRDSAPILRAGWTLQFLCKLEHKSLTWIIFWWFPYLFLETKPCYNGFLGSPRILDGINHHPHTAP